MVRCTKPRKDVTQKWPKVVYRQGWDTKQNMVESARLKKKKNPVHLFNSMTSRLSLKKKRLSKLYGHPLNTDYLRAEHWNGETFWHRTAKHELAGRRLANWIRLIPPMLWTDISQSVRRQRRVRARDLHLVVGRSGRVAHVQHLGPIQLW